MADLTGRIIGALQADVKTFEEIEADPGAFSQAITVIVIAGVAALIGNFFRVGVIGGIIHLVASVAEYALFSLLVFLIGTKLMPEPTTKSDFNETFRTVGFAAAPGIFSVLAIVPILGVLISFVIGIWSLVIGVIAVRQALDYSNTGRAIIVALIAGVICWVVVVIVFLPLALAAAVTHAAITG
jgi:hypothetical protein